MNERNLIPGAHPLTVEEQSKGGKRSGEVRRRKRNMKKCMELLLSLPASERNDYQLLSDMGVNFDELDEDEITNMLVVNAALVKYAKRGDVSAVKELRSIIRDDGYLDQKKEYDRARTRNDEERLKLDREKAFPPVSEDGMKYNGIPANVVAPSFASVLFDIKDEEHSEYVFPGGRGSTKSSFISLCIVDYLETHPDAHALVLRQVGNTLRESVFNQMLWAISVLGLDDEYSATVSPLEITKKSTGQKIYFRGADDENKTKSIKPKFGYIAVIWFEELDQFKGAESVRKIEQSAIRGGDKALKFKSFNPPKSAQNWANKWLKIPREDRLVTESTYLTVPKKWLGKSFIDDAEYLKAANPTAYENEYMGVANGTGGNVFDNVKVRKITDDEIMTFGTILHGVDWGWYPDPFQYVRCAWDPARRRLFIYDEYRTNKQGNQKVAEHLKKEKGVTPNDLLMCDSAEPKSIGDFKTFGLFARGVEKGPGSVDYSMKWLQSLTEIIIDNERCPNVAEEFLNYEYERSKDGEIISGYPDADNHSIDAVRYATSTIWRKNGR